MRLKKSKLREALLLALLGAGTIAVAAHAQETPDQESTRSNDAAQSEAQTLEGITVTGTRIKSQSMTASSPVAEIEAEAFKLTGATRADDLVNQFP